MLSRVRYDMPPPTLERAALPRFLMPLPRRCHALPLLMPLRRFRRYAAAMLAAY